MGEINKVTVMVHGQEYTLTADMPRDYVLKLADKVDTKMKELDDGSNSQPKSALAVLAAMLIADEYYTLDADTDALLAQNQKLNENAQSYERMWEELKTNYAAYREEVAGMSSSRETLQRYVAEKDQQIASLSAELEEEKRLNDELRSKVEDLIARLGEPLDRAYSSSCLVQGGQDGVLYYDGFTVYTLVQPDGTETVYDVE